MNVDMIKNDIGAYLDKYFGATYDIIDENLEFMEEYEFIEPKEDYFSSIAFLNATMNRFTNLDHAFSSETLRKLFRDIKNLQTLHQESFRYLEKTNESFDPRFLNKSPLFIEMRDEIAEFDEYLPLDKEDKETLALIKEQYSYMRKIYYENFKNEFVKQVNGILDLLKSVLNSKAYYFDRLLWLEASKSATIGRSLKAMDKTSEINSKTYIAHRLKVDLPYTDEYKYLQKCLRIHK
jgi:hypothetical protein